MPTWEGPVGGGHSKYCCNWYIVAHPPVLAAGGRLGFFAGAVHHWYRYTSTAPNNCCSHQIQSDFYQSCRRRRCSKTCGKTDPISQRVSNPLGCCSGAAVESGLQWPRPACCSDLIIPDYRDIHWNSAATSSVITRQRRCSVPYHNTGLGWIQVCGLHVLGHACKMPHAALVSSSSHDHLKSLSCFGRKMTIK